jgi:hypothetical protein
MWQLVVNVVEVFECLSHTSMSIEFYDLDVSVATIQ